MSDIRWDVLTIGHLSRNKFWGSPTIAPTVPRCTTTLIRAGQHTIIVDPGCPPQEMIAVLDQRAGLTAAAIDTVLLTHFHGDHRVGIGAFPHARWQMAAQRFDSYSIGANIWQSIQAWRAPPWLDRSRW